MSGYRNFCGNCGSSYGQFQIESGPHSPRECLQCGLKSWANPTPISVLLQPVYDYGTDPCRPRLRVGLLIGLRGIAPKLGEYGLPGGFVDPSDYSYELAAVREREEEIRFEPVPWWPEPKEPELYFSRRGDPGQIIAFSIARYSIPVHWLDRFVPCEECPAVEVMWEPRKLCFESHTEAAERWFADRAKQVWVTRHEALLDRVMADNISAKARAEIQTSCAHQWEEAPELYNYHKREDYQRCTRCALVV